MKIFSKLRKLGSKGKAMVCAAFATVSMAAMSIFASAAETGEETAGGMKATLATAGQSLMSGFNDLIDTMIPVIIGIFTSGLVIFGLFGLINLAKKIFGKVAG